MTNLVNSCKKVFWLSRHDMTEAQLKDLERIYGPVQIRKFSDTVTSAREVLEKAGDADVLAVVLPPAMLADLVNPRVNQKPVIRAKSNRVPTGDTEVNPATGKLEPKFRFEFAGWEQILRIVIETQDL